MEYRKNHRFNTDMLEANDPQIVTNIFLDLNGGDIEEAQKDIKKFYEGINEREI